MPIDSVHPDYEKNVTRWSKCRDVVEGEESVKNASFKYLPELGGQDDTEYEAYKMRALFYGATQRTVKALAGTVFARPMSLKFPKAKEDMLQTFGVDGDTFDSIAKKAVEEVLSVGRLGIYIDADASEDDDVFELSAPYATLYYAENIINWRFERIDGKKELSLVVLKETTEEQDDEDPSGYKVEECERYRVLLLKNGVFTVQVWEEQEQDDRQRKAGQDKWVKISDVTPTLSGGKTLDFIPFVFIGPTGITGNVEQSPILSLVNVNLSHYRTSADLEHGRHFTALPTAWAAGFETKQQFRIGSSVAWVTDNTGAKAGFLEFSGAGLGHLSAAIVEKEHMMAVLGSRLLEEQKRAAETAEAMALRQSGENSALTNVVVSVSNGLTKVLKWYATWASLDEASVSVELNTDFGLTLIDGPTLTALMAAVQSNMLSWDTWFYNVQRGGLIPDNVDKDTERQQIVAGPPIQAVGMPIPEPGTKPAPGAPAKPAVAGPGAPAKPGFPAPKAKTPPTGAGVAQAGAAKA